MKQVRLGSEQFDLVCQGVEGVEGYWLVFDVGEGVLEFDPEAQGESDQSISDWWAVCLDLQDLYGGVWPVPGGNS